MRISDWSSDVCSSDLLLVPQALQPHRRYLERNRREQLVQRLPLPERIVGWVFGELVPPWHQFQADRLRVIGRRTEDRQSVVKGKSVSVRVNIGGGRIIQKKHSKEHKNKQNKKK